VRQPSGHCTPVATLFSLSPFSLLLHSLHSLLFLPSLSSSSLGLDSGAPLSLLYLRPGSSLCLESASLAFLSRVQSVPRVCLSRLSVQGPACAFIAGKLSGDMGGYQQAETTCRLITPISTFPLANYHTQSSFHPRMDQPYCTGYVCVYMHYVSIHT
jgi:hypothetical protein